jgi:hypothetical protein
MVGKIMGLLPQEVHDVANILGENVFSEDLGVLLIRRYGASVKDILFGSYFCQCAGK